MATSLPPSPHRTEVGEVLKNLVQDDTALRQLDLSGTDTHSTLPGFGADASSRGRGRQVGANYYI